jgi:dipeptidyl aminopeptidase/acylaminoacyl peptidase
VGGAELLTVSPSGDLALSLNRRIVRGYIGTGTLTVMTEGQAPRELLDNVHWADWASDGKTLAIVRDVVGRTRLEFPANTILFETSGWISNPRFSPDGRRIAFLEHPMTANDAGHVMVIEPGGPPTALSAFLPSVLGLAWSASGQEVWFTAQDGNGRRALRAVDLHGHGRVVAHAPGRLRLLDISRDDRVLLARDDLRLEAHGAGPGNTGERNLSWLDWSLARDISTDGTRPSAAGQSGSGITSPRRDPVPCQWIVMLP